MYTTFNAGFQSDTKLIYTACLLCFAASNTKNTLGKEPHPALSDANWTDFGALIQCNESSSSESSVCSPWWGGVRHPVSELRNRFAELLTGSIKP